MRNSNRTSQAITFLVLTGCLLVLTVGMDLKIDITGFTFLVNTWTSLALLIFFGKPEFNLIKVYFSFMSIFMGLTPWIQYSKNIIMWSGKPFSDYDYILTNTIILISNLVIIFFYLLFKHPNYGALYVANQFIKHTPVTAPKIANKLRGFALCSTSTVCLIILLYLNDFSVLQLFFRGLIDEDAIPTEASSMQLIVGMLVRLLPFFSFIYYYTQCKRQLHITAYLLLMLFLCAFPTGIARYMVGFIYIPLLIIVFPNLKKGLKSPVTLIGAIFFAFPFLNQFRYYGNDKPLALIPDPDFFLQGHFDAYQNLCRVMKIEFITWGYQFLGVVFFYIPRTIWPNKPVGTGFKLSELQGYEFRNISMPLLGEGYANLGSIGLIMFCIVIASAMGLLDKAINLYERTFNHHNYLTSIYLYFCGALMFILRGDLLSSFAYTASGLVASVIVTKIVTLSDKIHTTLISIKT
jgi:hypothetical protein